MTIQSIGSASVALYITPADLKQYGLTPAELTLERALELTRSAFREAGITLEGGIEIEAYPESCGVLVFAHVRPAERSWFSFLCLEDLAAAARCMTKPCREAVLFWWGERWWLSLPGDRQDAAALLSEFGQCEDCRPHLDACLAEYGRQVLGENALTDILPYFPRLSY